MRMKILFVQTKYLCYDSSTAFTSAMKEALEKQSVQVIVLEIMEEKTAAAELQKLIGKQFDAVIDFNSVLPFAATEAGEYLLDLVDAPFYNYIVDHPMFHHREISIPLKNYHVICIDRNHKKYVEACYTHIKSVVFLPLAAMPSMMPVLFEQKKTKVLFPGTFMPSKEHYDKIQSFEARKREDLLKLVDRMLGDHTLTLETAVCDLWKERGRILAPQELKGIMLECYWVDYFVRTYYREQLIEGLLKAEIPLTVVGSGWERYHGPKASRLKTLEGVGYFLGLQMIANARITLNVQPLFKDGVHDRVLSAMLNKTVAVTDNSIYIEENFDTQKELVLYQPNRIDRLAERLVLLLDNQTLLEKTALAGYEKAVKQHTWDNRIQQLIKILKD